ncbi:MAG: hypothetical protein ACPL5I_13925, partial [Thermodesulfobacteriota bacterium]
LSLPPEVGTNFKSDRRSAQTTIDFPYFFCYIPAKFYVGIMKKGQRFLNLKLGKRGTMRGKPWRSVSKKKAPKGLTR